MQNYMAEWAEVLKMIISNYPQVKTYFTDI